MVAGRRRHFRGGPAFAFGYGVGYPLDYYDYYDYDYTTPYYGDDTCYQLRFYRGRYHRIWVCD